MHLPGEKLVIKLWESLADRGVGSLLTPWTIRREGKARIDVRRQELLMLEQAMVDASEIRAGRARLLEDGSLMKLPAPGRAEPGDAALSARVEPHLDLSSAIAEAGKTRSFEAARHEINAAKAVIFAEERLASDSQQPPDRDIEEDWIFAWREFAGRVSNEGLQRLWGEVLAGELKSPGRYSMRTLDFLRALSQEEAEVLSRLARFVIRGFIARSQATYLETQGLPFATLLKLRDWGVLSGVEAFGLTQTFGSSVPGKFLLALTSHKKILVVEDQDGTKTLDIDVYALTDVGQQVLSLGSFDADEQYLLAVGKEIASKGFRVRLADWMSRSEGGGQFSNARPIEA